MQEFDSPTRLMTNTTDYEPTEELTTIIIPACEEARKSLQFFKKGQYLSGKTDWDNTRPLRLRLDWDLGSDVIDEEPDKNPVGDSILKILYVDMMAADLDDLFQNGNKEVISDPLLSATDGSRKTGKKLVGLELVEQHLIFVFHERKDVYEYTLFVHVLPEWL